MAKESVTDKIEQNKLNKTTNEQKSNNNKQQQMRRSNGLLFLYHSYTVYFTTIIESMNDALKSSSRFVYEIESRCTVLFLERNYDDVIFSLGR